MKKREMINLGIPKGEPVAFALQGLKNWVSSGEPKTHEDIVSCICRLAKTPQEMVADKFFGPAAESCLKHKKLQAEYVPRREPAVYRKWGNNIDQATLDQIENSCRLPISVRGALMPDAHVGYGLPIGGVLATDNVVIPFAVGVDIACRMKLTVLDIPSSALKQQKNELISAIESETRFGVGATFRKRREHEVMGLDWSFSNEVSRLKDKAWSQLGTSGSGNHFVEFGTLTLEKADLGLPVGEYLALLSHSGSRGAGNEIATYYSDEAMKLHRELPKELMHLSWLSLDSDLGREYWQAMELMGKYAAANHELIHRHITSYLGAKVLLDIENHHNFAWREVHDGREVVVHRKGATPAGLGALGIIPGSMATPGFVVRGKGQPESLNSASHGAGRQMSRKKAIESFNWRDAKKFLADKGVTLISAGLDEVPMSYKPIEEVMAAQSDLVEVIARFDPRIVKMAPSGERPED